MAQKGGRAAIGGLSVIGAAAEGYSAYNSFTAGNTLAGVLHGAFAVGNGLVATGTFLRTPAGAMTGVVMATIGAVGAQIAEQD
jgi:hypothetical protein